MESGENLKARAPARSIDLALVRDSAERQRADAEMITGLCDTVYKLTTENQELKARIAALTPSEVK